MDDYTQFVRDVKGIHVGLFKKLLALRGPRKKIPHPKGCYAASPSPGGRGENLPSPFGGRGTELRSIRGEGIFRFLCRRFLAQGSEE